MKYIFFPDPTYHDENNREMPKINAISIKANYTLVTTNQFILKAIGKMVKNKLETKNDADFLVGEELHLNTLVYFIVTITDDGEYIVEVMDRSNNHILCKHYRDDSATSLTAYMKNINFFIESAYADLVNDNLFTCNDDSISCHNQFDESFKLILSHSGIERYREWIIDEDK